MQEAINKLERSLRATAVSSFNAAKRFEERDRKLTTLTAFASAYVIILTVLPYFVKMPTAMADLYNLVTVIFAIMILIGSLLQYSSNNVVKAEQFHRSGLEINELYRLFLIKKDGISAIDLQDFMGRYSNVLQKYSINYDLIDFRRYQLDRPSEYPDIKGVKKIEVYCWMIREKSSPTMFLIGATIVFLALVWNGASPLIKSEHASSIRNVEEPPQAAPDKPVKE